MYQSGEQEMPAWEEVEELQQWGKNGQKWMRWFVWRNSRKGPETSEIKTKKKAVKEY